MRERDQGHGGRGPSGPTSESSIPAAATAVSVLLQPPSLLQLHALDGQRKVADGFGAGSHRHVSEGGLWWQDEDEDWALHCGGEDPSGPERYALSPFHDERLVVEGEEGLEEVDSEEDSELPDLSALMSPAALDDPLQQLDHHELGLQAGQGGGGGSGGAAAASSRPPDAATGFHSSQSGPPLPSFSADLSPSALVFEEEDDDVAPHAAPAKRRPQPGAAAALGHASSVQQQQRMAPGQLPRAATAANLAPIMAVAPPRPREPPVPSGLGRLQQQQGGNTAAAPSARAASVGGACGSSRPQGGASTLGGSSRVDEAGVEEEVLPLRQRLQAAQALLQQQQRSVPASWGGPAPELGLPLRMASVVPGLRRPPKRT